MHVDLFNIRLILYMGEHLKNWPHNRPKILVIKLNNEAQLCLPKQNTWFQTISNINFMNFVGICGISIWILNMAMHWQGALVTKFCIWCSPYSSQCCVFIYYNSKLKSIRSKRKGEIVLWSTTTSSLLHNGILVLRLPFCQCSSSFLIAFGTLIWFKV